MATQPETAPGRPAGLTFAAVVLLAIGCARVISAIYYFADSNRLSEAADGPFAHHLVYWGFWDLIIAALALGGGYALLKRNELGFVLGYTFGVTCQMLGSGRGPAATLRVQEVFSRCKAVGVWRLRPATLQPCLVFVTRAANVNLAAKSMGHAPRKHVGIHANGFVWHYSDKQQAVIKETPSQFARYYSSPDTAMFYGSIM